MRLKEKTGKIEPHTKKAPSLNEMTYPASMDRKSPLIYFMIIILPFFLFYWMLPFVSDLSIGNDYQTTSIENQMELLFSIRNSSFPLFVPGFALGHSSSALTLGEVYHPISHIASVMPGYWDGKALQWNTFLRLISLGLTHLALFCFLRRLRLGTIFSFLISCITLYNLRMLDLFRYGAALEAYTAHLLLCAATGIYFINYTDPEKSGRRAGWGGPAAIIGATYLLICSGHPQMMYYGLLGAGFFALVIPSYIHSMLPDRHISFRTVLGFWAKTGLCLAAGILISSAYILPFYFEFIATNVERVGQDYAWADSIKDTFIGTLNNFFLPLRSDVHGAFGGSSIIIIAAILPLLKFFKVKIPRSVWVIWAMALFVFLHMQGSRTPLHLWIWEGLPFASSFRYAGRISLMMPILIMMLLAWAAQAGSFRLHLRNFSARVTPLMLLASVSVALSALYFLAVAISLLSPPSVMRLLAPFTPVAIRKVPTLAEILVILSGIATLLTLSYYSARLRTAGVAGILLCLLTIFQIGTVLKYGTWITGQRDTPTFEQMMAEKREKLEYRFYPGTGMYSSVVSTQLRRSFMEPFLGRIFYEVIPVQGQDEAYRRMQEGRTPEQVFIEGYRPGRETSVPSRDPADETGRVELAYSSFNRLMFRVITSGPAVFGFSYPYTGNWEASVNGDKAGLYRANGAAHAVPVPGGESLVEFRYRSPAALWGMVISSAVFVLTGLFFCFRIPGRIKRLSAAVAVITVGAGMFLLWQQGLYTGGNLGTKYTWTYSPPLGSPNLAYAKKTWTSSSYRGSPGYLHSSLAVDGDRTLQSGFATHPEDNPSWGVDLYRTEEIGSVVLYNGFSGPAINIPPLNLDLSVDGTHWRTAASIVPGEPWSESLRIDFEKPEIARYIRLQASGHCMLRMDEVEVYGPGIAD